MPACQIWLTRAVLVQIEKHVRWLWRFIMMPILFGLIGNAMRFNTLRHDSIAKACGIIVAGWLSHISLTCDSFMRQKVLHVCGVKTADHVTQLANLILNCLLSSCVSSQIVSKLLRLQLAPACDQTYKHLRCGRKSRCDGCRSGSAHALQFPGGLWRRLYLEGAPLLCFCLDTKGDCLSSHVPALLSRVCTGLHLPT